MAGQYPFNNPYLTTGIDPQYQVNRNNYSQGQQVPNNPMQYQPYMPPQMQQAVKSDDAAKIVPAVSDAENYPLAPMQTVYFIAMNDSALCVKSTDPVREPFVVYDLTKRNAEKPKEYVTKEEFNDLKNKIDELLK